MSTNDFIEALENELRLASRRRARLELARVPRPPAGAAAFAVALVVCAAVAVPLLATHSGTTAAHQSTTTPPASHGAVVGCQNAVYGKLARGWRGKRSGTITVGPIAWVYLRGAGNPAAIHRSHFIQALAVVNPGPDVIVSIPPSERSRLALDYTTVAPRSRFYVSQGVSSVAFQPCPRLTHGAGFSRQFDGGFIVAGPQCAEVDVRVAGNPTTMRRDLPLGRPCPTNRPPLRVVPVRSVLSGDGIGRARFGEKTSAVIDPLGALLGQSPSRRYHRTHLCQVDHEADWPGLRVFFRRGRFAGYAYGLAYQYANMAGPEPALSTLRGLRVGDPAQRGRRLYGSAFRLSAAQGGTWSVRTRQGRIFGYTSGPRDLQGPITSIEAGYVGCPALTP